MPRLAVIGNISIDESTYPDGRRTRFLGGAALHVALAASQAGLTAAPVSVIGDDLAGIIGDRRLAHLDLYAVARIPGPSCAFHLVYDSADSLVEIRCDYGVACQLTEHTLAHLPTADQVHVCCRRPLDAARVLHLLAEERQVFSIDFFTSSAAEMIAQVEPTLTAASTVFVNAAEYRMLTATIDPALLTAMVVTDGPRPAMLYRHGQLTASVTPTAVRAADVTGAGDTLAGTCLAGWATGLDDTTALQRAVEAATAHTLGTRLPVPAPTP
jgi:sugar/nucleoside kinase (ribokinase family)